MGSPSPIAAFYLPALTARSVCAAGNRVRSICSEKHTPVVEVLSYTLAESYYAPSSYFQLHSLYSDHPIPTIHAAAARRRGSNCYGLQCSSRCGVGSYHAHTFATQAARKASEADAVIEQLQADLQQACFELNHLQERLETCRSEYAHQVRTHEGSGCRDAVASY